MSTKKLNQKLSEIFFLNETSLKNNINNCLIDFCTCDDTGSCENCTCDDTGYCESCACDDTGYCESCTCDDICGDSGRDNCSCEDY